MKTASSLNSARDADFAMIFPSGSSFREPEASGSNPHADEWEDDLLASLYRLAEEKLESDQPAAAEKYAKCLLSRCPQRLTDVSLLKLLARATSRRHGSRSLADDVSVQLSRTSQRLHDVLYLLAEIFFIVNDLDWSYNICRRAMALRRMDSGKNAEETSQAVALLVEILRRRSAEFSEVEADAFEAMLPTDHTLEMRLPGEYSAATPSSHSPSPSYSGSAAASSSGNSAPSQHSHLSSNTRLELSQPSPYSNSRLELPPAPSESVYRQSEEIPSYAAVASEINEESAVQARRFLTTASASDSDEQVSPVFGAIMRKREDLIERLISKQRLINVRTVDNNRSLLHISAREGLKLTSRKLLEKGCEPNGRDDCGFTPLHYAAANGHWVIVDLLLHDGSDPGAAGMGRAQVTAADVVEPNIRVPSEEGERRTTAGERRRLEELVARHQSQRARGLSNPRVDILYMAI